MDGLTNMPLGGGIFLTIATYVAACFFITGPLIHQRTVEISGWVPACERSVVESVARDTPELQQAVPTPSCENILGMFAGRDGSALCEFAGPLFENPLAGQMEAANQRLIERYRNRVARAAEEAGSACTCAVNVASKENTSSWALHAGSFRLIEPAQIENYRAELSSALNSDYCRGEFK